MNWTSHHESDDDEDSIWKNIVNLDYSSEEELDSSREPHGPRHGSSSVPNIPRDRGRGEEELDSSREPRHGSSSVPNVPRDRGRGEEELDSSREPRHGSSSVPLDRVLNVGLGHGLGHLVVQW